MSKKIRNSLILVFAALIWGIAFVAQSEGGDAVGPYSFNCIRTLMGCLVLLPVIAFLDKAGLSSKKPVTKEEKKLLWKAGISCGIPLFFAANTQQLGIYLGSGAGKAGFVTACYILIVPVLGLFLKKKCGWNIWLGVVITLAGLYLLCINGDFSVSPSDTFLLMCAFLFSIQILMVDKYAPVCDGVRLSCLEFFISGMLGIIPTIFIDIRGMEGGFSAWLQTFASWNAWIPILYAGVMSCGVAYTLQIIGQNGLNPTLASMLMSLESVFSVIAGALLLGEKMSAKELGGCVLIFAAIVIAQLPVSGLGKVRN